MSNSKISALTSASTPLVGTEVLPIVQSSATVKTSVDSLTTGRTITPLQVDVVNTSVTGILSAASSLYPGGTGDVSASVILKSNNTASWVGTREMVRLDAQGNGADHRFGSLSIKVKAAAADANPTEMMLFDPIRGNTSLKIGDYTVTSGNVVIGTSGKGIDFSATPGTGTSELLADYEEGTWTPNLTGDGGGSGQTYTAQTGTYTKIGRVVTVNFYINLSAKGTITGNAIISNLPFTVLNTGSLIAGGALALWSNLAVNHNVIGMFCNTNTTNIYLWGSIVVASTPPLLTTTDIANNTRFWGSVTYMTA